MNDIAGNFSELLKELKEDINKTAEHINNAVEASNFEDCQYYYRGYVRAVAAWAEASLFVFKTTISKVEYRWYLNLETVEQLYLHDIDWKVSNGKPTETRRKNLSIKDDLKAFFSISEKLFEDFNGISGSYHWGQFLRLLEARDKLMHPKSSSDLMLSKQQIDDFEAARNWLGNLFINLGKSVVKKIDIEESKKHD